MRIFKRFSLYTLALLTILCGGILLIYSATFRTYNNLPEEIRWSTHAEISINGGAFEQATLPLTISNIPPKTPVVVKTTLAPSEQDSLCFKIVYSPCNVYIDGNPVLQMGKSDSYPDFMADPATEIHMLKPVRNEESLVCRMEFRSPVSRNSLTVHPIMMAPYRIMLRNGFKVLGPSLVLSLVQLVSGLLMGLISFFLHWFDRKSSLIFWIGLFAFTSGLWSLGENDLVGLFFQFPTFLYLMTFIGLFTLSIPLIQALRSIIYFQPGSNKLLWWMELIFTAATVLCFFLQLMGLVQFSQSILVSHIMIATALITLSVLLLREAVTFKSVYARRFLLPVFLLTAMAGLELANYQAPFTYVFSAMFQIGLQLFLLFTSVIGGLYIKESADLRARQKQMELEQNLMDLQLKEQQRHSELLTQQDHLLREQRHDLRHHLSTMQQLLHEDPERLDAYLESLIGQLPKAGQKFCENRAVHAVASHYHQLCLQRSIALNMSLLVPDTVPGGVTDVQLCSIFGNLLENAVEACGRMKSGQKFIRIRSTVQKNMLVITMDNSFNGQVQQSDNHFISSKQGSNHGLGLTSIQSIAQSYGGDARFQSSGNLFQSNVYLQIAPL